MTAVASATVRVGTAGWGLPRQWRDRFPDGGSYLERYAACFSAVEINSSFYRPHRRAVYEKWAASVPQDFRFAVKLPQAITHDQRLVAADVLLDVFLDDVRGLGDRLGPLLVQLPPSLEFDVPTADEFLAMLRSLHGGPIACEPRHESWFTVEAEAMLIRYRIARAGADPARWPAAAVPGGDGSLCYLRLHGSPQMYYSDYTESYLRGAAALLRGRADAARECWCIFDNTTLGAATGNALTLSRLLAGEGEPGIVRSPPLAAGTPAD
ncbi:MAG TPA: DUF72 domain-containing protein [Gemmatimonadaceae bacterium]